MKRSYSSLLDNLSKFSSSSSSSSKQRKVDENVTSSDVVKMTRVIDFEYEKYCEFDSDLIESYHKSRLSYSESTLNKSEYIENSSVQYLHKLSVCYTKKTTPWELRYESDTHEHKHDNRKLVDDDMGGMSTSVYNGIFSFIKCAEWCKLILNKKIRSLGWSVSMISWNPISNSHSVPELLINLERCLILNIGFTVKYLDLCLHTVAGINENDEHTKE